jgi:hypothetical protein
MNRLPRRPRVAAAGPLLALALALLPGPATAGTYTWGPIIGLGNDQPPPLYQPIYFSSSGGTLTIDYDPNDLVHSRIDVETGNPAYGATGSFLTVSVLPGSVTITGSFQLGGVVGATIFGDPGPLDSQGNPLSLDSLLGDKVEVGVSPSYHSNELTFRGQSVPEPSSLLTLALGIGGVSVARAVRRLKRRPGPRGFAGRS